MNLGIAILVALGGYLIGSISFTRIIGKRVAPDEDLSYTEVSFGDEGESFAMRSVSATSLSFRKGPKVGCLTSILDMLKAILPTLAVLLYFPEQDYHLIATAAAMAGHNFPIYYNFQGGRGMSTLYGGLLLIDWLSIPITFIGGALLGALMRDMFLIYTSGILLLIPWLWYRYESLPYVLFAIAVNVLFWVAIRTELRDHLQRKRTGQTGKIDFKQFWIRARAMWLQRQANRMKSESEENMPQ